MPCGRKETGVGLRAPGKQRGGAARFGMLRMLLLLDQAPSLRPRLRPPPYLSGSAAASAEPSSSILPPAAGEAPLLSEHAYSLVQKRPPHSALLRPIKVQPGVAAAVWPRLSRSPGVGNNTRPAAFGARGVQRNLPQAVFGSR